VKIAIARGNNLNPFEMQNYGPIASSHDLMGYGSFINNFETERIPFPVKKLHTTEEYYRRFPSPARSLAYGLSLRSGFNQRMFGLEKELEDKDIIHTAETYTGYSYQAARMKKGKNKKLVLTVWENIPFLSTHQFMGFDSIPLFSGVLRRGLTGNDRIVKYVQDNADMLIAVTGPAKKALMMEGVAEEKIRVQPMGVDTRRFSPAPPDMDVLKKLGILKGDFVVLFIGRLGIEKGIYDLIEAAGLVSSDPDMANVKFVMAGSGPERENLVRRIALLKLEGRVCLAGSFPYDAIPGLYNAADMFILPSIPVPFWQEQFGMVLAEAMASGIPVVSTLTGSIPEVVGESGALVPPGDPAAMYREIKKLHSDAPYRRALAAKGRERALTVFDIGKVSRGIESLYKELL
jgi:glycosyltransferase involved in cell wall biosynthesis